MRIHNHIYFLVCWQLFYDNTSPYLKGNSNFNFSGLRGKLQETVNWEITLLTKKNKKIQNIKCKYKSTAKAIILTTQKDWQVGEDRFFQQYM